MNETEIASVLRGRCHPGIFVGVMAADEVMSSIGPGQIGICNTEERGHRGQHWTVISRVGDNAFFDSFGRGPGYYKTYWEDFISENHSKPFLFSSRKMQSESESTCGEYCIAFVLSICQGKSFEKTVETLAMIDIKMYTLGLLAPMHRYFNYN